MCALCSVHVSMWLEFLEKMKGKKGFCRFIIFFPPPFLFHQRMFLFALISHHPCIFLALHSYFGIRMKYHFMHESTATNDDNCGALILWNTSVFKSTCQIKQFFSTIFRHPCAVILGLITDFSCVPFFHVPYFEMLLASRLKRVAA